jgi:hypothetical protein
MLGKLGFGLAVVALAAAVAASALAAPAPGRLTGLTQISFGCPGPTREGRQCDRWSPLGDARFALMRETAAGLVVAGTRRVVVSDAQGRFTLRLLAGHYRFAPLPQAHTTGGPLVHVVVRSGVTTSALVRFEGFPKMV